jgi:hypothetical protein
MNLGCQRSNCDNFFQLDLGDRDQDFFFFCRYDRDMHLAVIAVFACMLGACGGDDSGPSMIFDLAGLDLRGVDLSSTSSNDMASDGSVEQLCVDTINMYRATLGLPPYARWTDGESCADGEAQSDSMTGTAHGAFGTCGEHAQDECPGWPTPESTAITGCLAQMWAEGPGSDFATHGHYINMSSTQYTKASCGFYLVNGNSVWATQNFQ